MTFGDAQVHVGHPGILIGSMDGEEVAHWTAVRAASVLHLCPKCLVHQCNLHSLSLSFKKRIIPLMQEALSKAQAAPNATQKEKILQSFGMRDIDHFLWKYRFCDPYAAASYDVLHFTDLGKFGKHIWPLLLKVLQDLRVAGQFNE